jgi:hypothetical protein
MTAAPLAWPELDETALNDDSVAFWLAQAETAWKSQVEGADRLLARVPTLLTASLTLGLAALSAVGLSAGVFSAGSAPHQAVWLAPAFMAAALLLLAAAAKAALNVQALSLAAPGYSPADSTARDHRGSYDPSFLGASKRESALFMLRVAGAAITANAVELAKLTRSVRLVIMLMVSAPGVFVAVAALGWGVSRLPYFERSTRAASAGVMVRSPVSGLAGIWESGTRGGGAAGGFSAPVPGAGRGASVVRLVGDDIAWAPFGKQDMALPRWNGTKQ